MIEPNTMTGRVAVPLRTMAGVRSDSGLTVYSGDFTGQVTILEDALCLVVVHDLYGVALSADVVHWKDSVRVMMNNLKQAKGKK